MRLITKRLTGPVALGAALLALAACAVPEARPGTSTDATTQERAAVRDLTGQWVIEGIDGQALPEPIALTGNTDSLLWEPACAGQNISYRAVGDQIEFYRPKPEGDGPPIVCMIAYPQDLPRVFDALEGRWTASQAGDGGVQLSREGARIALEPATSDGPATLAGEWRVAGIDGEPFDEPYGIALSADDGEIWWEPRCAGVKVAYRLSGARFEAPPALQPPPPVAVCKIGQPPRLAEVMKAIRAADRIERTAANGIRLSGKGRSLTLFSQ